MSKDIVAEILPSPSSQDQAYLTSRARARWLHRLQGKTARRLLSLLGGLFFGYVVFQVFRSSVPWQDFQRVGITTLALVAGAQLLNDLLVPVQWKVLHSRLGPLPWTTCFKVILPNVYVSYFPIRGAIILVRMYAARLQGVPFLLSAPSLFLLFFWRWVVILALLPLVPFIIPGLEMEVSFLAATVLGILLLGYVLRRWLFSLVGAVSGRALGNRLPEELRSGVESLEQRVLAILRSRAILIHTGIFLGVSLATTVTISLLLRDLDHMVNPFVLLLAWYASLSVGWLSHLPGGVGAQEASFAYLVSLLGVPLPVALAVAVLWRIVVTVVDLAVSGGSMLAFRGASRPHSSQGPGSHEEGRSRITLAPTPEEAGNDAAASEEATAADLSDGKRLKVTLVGTLPPIKGVSPYCLALARSLEGHVSLEFLGFRSLYPDFLYPGGTRTDPHHQPPLRWHNTRVRNLLTYYNPLSWIWAGLSLQGEIVHAQWWSYVLAPPYAVLLALARLRGRRCVLTVHNVLPHEQSRVSKLLNRAIVRFGSQFIVHTERNREELVRLLGIPAGRIHVVPHGVLEPAPIRGTGREEARRRLGIPLGVPVVLHFGNIRDYKGVDVLLKAMGGVIQEQPQALLVLAGKPWGSWQPYARIIQDLGLERHVREQLRFIQPGEVEDFFAAADVVALPYQYFDSQSGVGAMALSFGRAMVVTDVGGLPDLVRDPQSVVPPGEPHALARAVLRILSDPGLRQRLEEDAWGLRDHYQWKDIAQATVAVYRQALAGERAAAMKGLPG